MLVPVTALHAGSSTPFSNSWGILSQDSEDLAWFNNLAPAHSDSNVPASEDGMFGLVVDMPGMPLPSPRHLMYPSCGHDGNDVDSAWDVMGTEGMPDAAAMQQLRQLPSSMRTCLLDAARLYLQNGAGYA